MSIFPTKVLLATDSSKESGLAAQTAADMAENTSSELHIVLVGLSVGYVGMGPPEIADIPAPRQEDLNEEAQRLLEAQVQQIEADGGAVAQAHLRVGRPDEEIVALAEEIGAGLIVMGSRGLGGIRRLLMGSVSVSVVRHAHCPVLVVRAEKMDDNTLRARLQLLVGLTAQEPKESHPSGTGSLALTPHGGRRRCLSTSSTGSAMERTSGT